MLRNIGSFIGRWLNPTEALRFKAVKMMVLADELHVATGQIYSSAISAKLHAIVWSSKRPRAGDYKEFKHELLKVTTVADALTLWCLENEVPPEHLRKLLSNGIAVDVYEHWLQSDFDSISKDKRNLP